MKGVAPGVVHKAQAGAVALDLSGPTAVRRAANEIAARLDAAGTPAADFLVQRMADAGIEMLVGVLADERFGPVVACGAGGGTAEVLGDVAVRLAPLAREEALDMIHSLRSLALLQRTGGDIDALADIAVRVGALADAHPAIAELDLNPVMVGPEGAPVVDARVRVTPPAIQPVFPAVNRYSSQVTRGTSLLGLVDGAAMKRIGLLGGMSWESTIEYYRLINELVAERLGGLHSADCILRSVDFADIEVMQREGRWADAGTLLAREAQALEHAGAELLVLCTNTMHKLATEIELALTIPFVHIADTTAAAVLGDGLDRVGLLATAYTMEQDFYTGRLRDHGLVGARPGRGGPQDRPRRDLRRAVPRRDSRRVAGGVSADHGAAGRGRRAGDPARVHGDRPAGRCRRCRRAGLRHDPPARRARGRAQRGVRRVAAAFQVAVTVVPGAS